ncbi:MAG: DUF1330 domain-containing protein [Anderseniella sp.]
MSGFVIHHYNIVDRSRVGELGPLSLPIVEKYGGTILIASPLKALKGSTYSNMVVYQFDSFDAALTFYHSNEMTDFAKLRDQIIDGISMVLPGHSETDQVVSSGYFSTGD